MTSPPRPAALRQAARQRLSEPRSSCLPGAIAHLLLLGGFAAASGCYSPMYSQPYGYPGYGYGQPGMQYAPGPAYPAGAYPGTTLGAPTFDGTTTPPAGTGSDAPIYYPPAGTPSGGTGSNPVPNYYDPETTGGNAYGSINNSSPHLTAGAGEDFTEPIPGPSPISLTQAVRALENVPYGYDNRGYRWLQGLVSREPDGTWSILYSAIPDLSDEFGGDMTLVASSKLATLKDGDVVRLEGEVDTSGFDKSGRALYRVHNVTMLSQ
jgi:hypothetical protein